MTLAAHRTSFLLPCYSSHLVLNSSLDVGLVTASNHTLRIFQRSNKV